MMPTSKPHKTGVLVGFFCALSRAVCDINVVVTCNQDHIDIWVRQSEGVFTGIVHSRPDKQRCSVIGTARHETHLVIPLEAEMRRQCGVVEHNNSFIAVVDVRQHPSVEMLTDQTYLITCPIDITRSLFESRAEVNIGAHVNVLMDEDEVEAVRVGQVYTMMVKVPMKERNTEYRMGQCIAFTGLNDVQLLQLTDNDGCPTVHEVLHEFQSLHDSSQTADNSELTRLQTKIEMFRFNNSDHFFLQCQLVPCNGANGTPGCLKPTECQRPEIDMRGLIAANRLKATLIGKRINIERNVQIIRQEKDDPNHCDFESQQRNKAFLSILFGILIMLSTIVWIAAWYNRPFREGTAKVTSEEAQNQSAVPEQPLSPHSRHRLIFSGARFRKNISNFLSTIVRRDRVNITATLHAFGSPIGRKKAEFLSVDDLTKTTTVTGAIPKESLPAGTHCSDKPLPATPVSSIWPFSPRPKPHPRRSIRPAGHAPALPPKAANRSNNKSNTMQSSLSVMDRLPAPPSVSIRELHALNRQLDSGVAQPTAQVQDVHLELHQFPHRSRAGQQNFRRTQSAGSQRGQLTIDGDELPEERVFGGTLRLGDREAHREFARFAQLSRANELRHTVGGKFLNWHSTATYNRNRRAFDDANVGLYQNFRSLTLNSTGNGGYGNGTWNPARSRSTGLVNGIGEPVGRIQILDEYFGERPRSCASVFPTMKRGGRRSARLVRDSDVLVTRV